MSVHHSDFDRISHLPGNVLDNILIRLPIRDAVRTNILSKKWRNKWADIPHLIFDRTFQPKRPSSKSDYKLLMMTIYEVLLLHFGPIHKFVLSIPGLKSCPEIDRLILFLSRKDIQHFKLRLSNGDRHKLPSYLYSCLQLKRLSLHLCTFIPPPSFEGFSRLVSLKLWEVQLSSNFTKIISNFLLLERLWLCGCTEIPCLKINCPNLKFLRYCGPYKSLCFKNVPHLAYVLIVNEGAPYPTSEGEKVPDLIQVLGSLPALMSLNVDRYFLKTFVVHDALKRLSTPLEHLKTIKFFGLCFDELEEILSALFLLTNSPNLQSLQIEECEEPDTDVNATTESLELLVAQEHYELSLNKLQEVKMLCFNGSRPEVEFVRFLLAKSSALRTICLQPREGMSSEEELTILKEIIRFPRASPNAEIICEDYVQESEEECDGVVSI